MMDPVAEHSPGERADAVPVERTPIRIVIADDHPIFRDGLRRLLSLENDFEIVGEARDGHEVIEVLDQQDPDILLLDLRMPGLDGLAVLQKLQYSKRKTKVIVLTASDDKNEFVQAMKFGCSGIVLKQTATDLLAKAARRPAPTDGAKPSSRLVAGRSSGSRLSRGGLPHSSSFRRAFPSR